MPKSKLAELIAAATPEELAELGITPAAQAAAIQEKQAARKPKKRVTTRKVKKVFEGFSGMIPPGGFRWAYNRLDRIYESMFDGIVYAFDPHEYRLLTIEVARFLWAQSVISYDPTKRFGVRALALDPLSPSLMEAHEADGFGEPMGDPKNVELLDRSTDPNPIGKSTGGIKTKPAVVSITAGATALPLTVK